MNGKLHMNSIPDSILYLFWAIGISLFMLIMFTAFVMTAGLLIVTSPLWGSVALFLWIEDKYSGKNMKILK